MRYRLARKRSTLALVAAVLLAGVFHLCADCGFLYVNTVMFCLNYAVYAGALLFWVQSVRSRLLPSRSKTYILADAAFMFLLLLIRTLKYRIVPLDSWLTRFCWYGYYFPFIMMVTLFLMCCLRFAWVQSAPRRADERLLLIPALLLAVGVLTNDAHHLAFRPLTEDTAFFEAEGTYAHGVLYWAAFAWTVLCALAGMAALVRRARRLHSWWKTLPPLLFLTAIPVLVIMKEILNGWGLRFPYYLPELMVFGVLGAFEACIRSHLMPNNENYAGFFARMEAPVVIADSSLKAVYRTAAPLRAAPEQMRAALSGPVYPDEDTRLRGMAIRGGYAFWEEDEGELRRMNERLLEANETLALENEMIRHENELKEKRERLESRNRIYSRIAAGLYPTQERIAALLDAVSPDAPGFRRTLAVCCVMNAYVKRRSNLLLFAEDAKAEDSRELVLALEESARYLKYCDVEAAVLGSARAGFSLTTMCLLYDTFEALVEAFLPHMRRLTVSVTGDGLRLMVDADGEPPMPATPLPVEKKRGEDCLYLTVTARREAAA